MLKSLASKSFEKLLNFVDPEFSQKHQLTGDDIAATLLGKSYRKAVIIRWARNGFVVNFPEPKIAKAEFVLTYKPAPNRREISNNIKFTFHYSDKHKKWFLQLK